ncbi:MAG: undecaprenyl/decaprenyl-phosphate alpha-N-acetylglucosaminyl 1-phosphate transferase [Phycisphaerales bacterium]|nr:undecaprenyl/decaprenyl-phosphate alpha-N-acetylglucosaminyl 1-phosphate transferase [Phycisphaerales bacterium]
MRGMTALADAAGVQVPVAVPRLEPLAPGVAGGDVLVSAVELLNIFVPVLIAGFAVTLVATPFVRALAVSSGIVDAPDQSRKLHGRPIAYLGGVAIFLGTMAAVAVSFIAAHSEALAMMPVPISILVGIVAIAFTGLADDIWKLDPRVKIAGQLVAAAALAYEEIGVGVAQCFLSPLLGSPEIVWLTLGPVVIDNAQVYYWAGTATVAIFVIGGCNSANLIDGLDGLLAGTGAIMALGFLAIALLVAAAMPAKDPETSLVGVRVVLAMALLGVCLGFLPWNFNPATIFLGDCGSLLIGYLSVVTILTLGETGSASLVIAGLIVFALPILDTLLAIIRRKIAGRPMSSADHNHIHHQIKRALHTVKLAVFALYGITFMFAGLGATVAAVTLLTRTRALVIFALAFMAFSFVSAVAIKIAALGRWDAQARMVPDGQADGAPDAP